MANVNATSSWPPKTSRKPHQKLGPGRADGQAEDAVQGDDRRDEGEGEGERRPEAELAPERVALGDDGWGLRHGGPPGCCWTHHREPRAAAQDPRSETLQSHCARPFPLEVCTTLRAEAGGPGPIRSAGGRTGGGRASARGPLTGTEGVEPTLRDLLATPSLRLRVAVAQEDGLDHRVRWAQATELPDPSPYLRGGELVCSVGTTLTTPERCEDFVRVLAAAGVAGLCFGLGDVHEEVPTALREACERYGVPLLLAPLGAPFSAISEYLAGRRLEAETAATRTAETLVSQLLSGLRARASVSDAAGERRPGRWAAGSSCRVAGQPVAAAGPALDAEPGAPAPSTQQLEAG